MKRFLLSIFLSLFLITTISAFGFVDEGLPKLEAPAPGFEDINYSLVPTVNSSDFWDNLDDPFDIDHNLLNNLEWSVAGHIIDENFNIGGYSFLGKYNWTSGDTWNIFDGSILTFNESKLEVIYYNATSVEVVLGTLDDGDVESTWNFGGESLNVSETNADPGLDIRINFTNVDDFNQLIVRFKTDAGSDPHTSIEIYDFINDVWENHDYYIESLDWDNPYMPIWDSSVHISRTNEVWVRIYLDDMGKLAHTHFFDFVQLSDGVGTVDTTESDPLSWHRDENISAENYNATFDWVNAENLNVTGNVNIDGNLDLGWNDINNVNFINSTYGNFSNLTGDTLFINHIAEKTTGHNVVIDNDVDLGSNDLDANDITAGNNFYASDGTQISPSYATTGDPTTGMYFSTVGAPVIRFSVGNDDFLDLASFTNTIIPHKKIDSTHNAAFNALTIKQQLFPFTEWTTDTATGNWQGTRYSNVASTVQIMQFSARGTEASPSSLLDNDIVGGFNTRAWNSAIGGFSSNIGQVLIRTNLSHGGNDLPTKLTVRLTPDGSATVRDVFRIFSDGNVILPFDNQAIKFGAGQDAQIYWDGTNMIFDYNTTRATAVAWFSGNTSAVSYDTRTSVYNKLAGDPFDYIKDADDYKNPDGTIKHDEFYGFKINQVADLSKPKQYEKCEMSEDNNGEEFESCFNVTRYPHTKDEEVTSLNDEIDLLRQASYLDHQTILALNQTLQSINSCLASSKDFIEYKNCVGLGVSF